MPAVSSRGRGRRTIAEINMVPFIDVMLVLLIIFMVTAPMLSQGIKVDLPKAATRKSSEMALGPLTEAFPELLGGSADLTGSNNTKTSFTKPLMS